MNYLNGTKYVYISRNDTEHIAFSSSKVVQRFELSHEGVPIGLTTGILNSPDR